MMTHETTQTGHSTPRPWRIDRDVDEDEGFLIVNDKGESLMIVFNGGSELSETLDEGLANANLVVRAVNSHDVLVEALERSNVMLSQQIENLLKSDQSDENGRKMQIEECWTQMDRNDKALALARGEV